MEGKITQDFCMSNKILEKAIKVNHINLKLKIKYSKSFKIRKLCKTPYLHKEKYFLMKYKRFCSLTHCFLLIVPLNKKVKNKKYEVRL